MQNENLAKNKLEAGADQGQGLAEAKKLSREAIEQFRMVFRTSLEKLKEYGVEYGLIDSDTPLDEVRSKLIEKIKELSERNTERRSSDAGPTNERRRKNRRHS